MDESLYSRRSNLVIGFHGCDQLEESIRIILIHNIKGVSFLPHTSGKRGYTFFFLSPLPSNIFPKFLASFRRKAYLCRKKKRCQQYSYFSDSDSCFILMIMNQFMSMLSRMEMKQNTMYPL